MKTRLITAAQVVLIALFILAPVLHAPHTHTESPSADSHCAVCTWAKGVALCDACNTAGAVLVAADKRITIPSDLLLSSHTVTTTGCRAPPSHAS